MMQQTILFNLDDTLIQCNKYFGIVINQFTAHLEGLFRDIPVTKEQIILKQAEIDLGAVEQHGLSSKHFLESLVQTYIFFCTIAGKPSDDEEIERIQKLGLSVYEFPAEPLPYMYEMLEELKQEGHDLYLHTGGDEEIQRNKIIQLELAVYFDNKVFVSTHKNTNALAAIVKQMNMDLMNTWMIGNSLRTDIVPGLEVGMNVIYIPAAGEWHYNIIGVNIQPKGVYLTLKSLQDVPRAIRERSYFLVK